jgi:CHAT domain-containing protein
MPAPGAERGLWARLFGRRPAAPPAAATPSPPAGEARPPGRLSRDLDRGRLAFSRLPGTRLEGEQVGGLLGVRPWLEGEALEGRLKGCGSPRVLHLATHGFFLPDRPPPPPRSPFGPEAIGWGAAPGPARLSGPALESPMLRSGLALAGANTWLKAGTAPAEAEDGLLTAEDVLGLDLLDTELVVLSACETGLGEVHVSEGVFGLRRAFVAAGAKTLVMSLWKVPDLATAVLMGRFYENLLARHMARDEALRDAQFYTRDVTVGRLRRHWLSPEVIERLAAGSDRAKGHLQELARRPDDHRPFAHPRYWGAFICQGDTAPLPDSGPAVG